MDSADIHSNSSRKRLLTCGGVVIALAAVGIFILIAAFFSQNITPKPGQLSASTTLDSNSTVSNSKVVQVASAKPTFNLSFVARALVNRWPFVLAFGLVLVSLLAAVAIWHFVNLEKETEMNAVVDCETTIEHKNDNVIIDQDSETSSFPGWGWVVFVIVLLIIIFIFLMCKCSKKPIATAIESDPLVVPHFRVFEVIQEDNANPFLRFVALKAVARFLVIKETSKANIRFPGIGQFQQGSILSYAIDETGTLNIKLQRQKVIDYEDVDPNTFNTKHNDAIKQIGTEFHEFITSMPNLLNNLPEYHEIWQYYKLEEVDDDVKAESFLNALFADPVGAEMKKNRLN